MNVEMLLRKWIEARDLRLKLCELDAHYHNLLFDLEKGVNSLNDDESREYRLRVVEEAMK
jgi:hypothetical protein